MFYEWRPYVSVAQRRRQAAREMDKLHKKGHPVAPVTIKGRTIASTFWGKAWCDNLERYSDYENRMPRGRTYVRNGSVVDLQVAPGLVTAMVSGSELYKVEVKVTAVPRPHWESICTDCAGGIDSLVELLQGRFAKGVMERICLQGTGLFPAAQELSFRVAAPTGRRCANTSPLPCTAWAPDSTPAPSCCFACARWTRASWSHALARTCLCRRRQATAKRSWPTAICPNCSGWTSTTPPPHLPADARPPEHASRRSS